jgi:hypothetical protein
MPIRPENKIRYPANWPQISDRIRFERAGGRCESAGECDRHPGQPCTAVHGEPHPVTRSRGLTGPTPKDLGPQTAFIPLTVLRESLPGGSA